MEQRPAPPVTIEGGAGRQLHGESPDTLGDDVPVGSRARLRLPRLGRPSLPAVVAVALAAVTGTSIGTAATDVRTQVLAETDASTLSLEVGQPDDQAFFDVVETRDGRPATAVVLELRNTGPRAVGLRGVELAGTGFAAEDVDGRRLGAGERTNVSLVRPLDCSAPAGTGVAAPAVRVSALTDAGPRQVELRSDLAPIRLTGELERRACGVLPAAQALVITETGVGFADGVVRLGVQLGNASAAPLTVRNLRVPAGLAARLVEPDGREVALPLTLPGQAFSRPRRPFDPPEQTRELVAEISVASCDELTARAGSYTDGEPLVAVEVQGDVNVAFFGDPFLVVTRLQADRC